MTRETRPSLATPVVASAAQARSAEALALVAPKNGVLTFAGGSRERGTTARAEGERSGSSGKGDCRADRRSVDDLDEPRTGEREQGEGGADILVVDRRVRVANDHREMGGGSFEGGTGRSRNTGTTTLEDVDRNTEGGKLKTLAVRSLERREVTFLASFSDVRPM